MNNQETLTPEGLLDILRTKVADERVSAAKTALTVGEARSLIERIDGARPTSPDKVEDKIIELLETYEQNNPLGDGIPLPQIWSALRKSEPIASGLVEDALSSLLKQKRIYSRRNGLTVYLPGRDPEDEDEAGDAQPPKQESVT